MASRRIAAIALAAAVCMVGLHLQDDHGASELVECGRNGCYATDSRAREPIHASALDPLAGSDTIHRAYSESGEIRGVNGGHVARGIRWQAAKRDRSHLRLERVGVHIGGSAMEKAVPAVFWDESEYDWKDHHSPRTEGDLRRIRQRSLKGQSKLAEYGVNVDSSWLGRTHKFPTQGLDSLSTRPCGGVGTFVAATGGMQGEPYLLGGVSKAEHSSRDMLELSGVKVGTLNSRVRDENSGVDHPCLLNSPIVGADEKVAGIPHPTF